MKICGVIAEYNPFHNGHKYHLDSVKTDFDACVTVMSGNYVERSETAVFSKRYRTMTAFKNGADLVIELPLCYSAASAEKFAFGGVYLLNALGCVDSISFGSECGDISQLIAAASAVNSPLTDGQIQFFLKSGMSYPAAREKAVETLFGKDVSSVLSDPNNILGIEYIKALNKLNSNIIPVTLLRSGEGHNSKNIENDIISASAVRELIKNEKDISHFVPESTLKIIENAEYDKRFPSDFNKLSTAIIASLRQKSSRDFSDIPDVSEGIENRILSSAKTAVNLDELYMNAKTKRYTHSRIRRIVLFSFLGITYEYYNLLPQYIKVLGFNDTGRQILKKMSETAALPIVMSASDIKKLSVQAQKQFSLECRSTDIFNMTLPEIVQSGTEMTDNIVKYE